MASECQERGLILVGRDFQKRFEESGHEGWYDHFVVSR